MELTKQNKQQVQVSTPAAFSQKLMQCLINLEMPKTKSEAKMELVLMTNQLMPEGRPQYLSVVKYPTIRSLIEQVGRKKMLAILVLMVKDFCSSVNVVRNMNEDQMIEVGSMLLEECGNFRMEDYVMMFNIAKRGGFSEVKIMDRVDIQLISSIMDAYWQRRSIAGQQQLDNEVMQLEGISQTEVARVEQQWIEGKGYVNVKSMDSKISTFTGFIGEIAKGIKENNVTNEQLNKAISDIKTNTKYKNPYHKPDDNNI